MRILLFGKLCCTASYRALTTISKKIWDRLTAISLDNQDIMLTKKKFDNEQGGGGYRTLAASECVTLLRSFFEGNSQYYPMSRLKYLTTIDLCLRCIFFTCKTPSRRMCRRSICGDFGFATFQTTIWRK